MSAPAKANTWMPFYVGDYLADTMSLNATQHGAYLLLLMHQWRNGPLPDDDEELASIARCEISTWKKSVGPRIRRFFTVTPEGLSQKRLAREKQLAEANTERKALAGKAGAASRWQKGTKAMPSDSDANSNRIATAWRPDDFANAPSPSPSPKAAAAGVAVGATENNKASCGRKICRSDPPDRWAVYTDDWEFDDKKVRRPVVGGEYLDVLANRVLKAAGIFDTKWEGDFGVIVGWLESGLDGNTIVAAVRQVAQRSGYKAPKTLKYFDGAVRDYRVPGNARRFA